MTDTSYLSAVRESYDTVAADYAASVKPPAELDPVSRAMLAAFAEFHRVLAPGGYLMLVCRVGKDEHLRRTLAYGDHPAPFESYRLPADRISELLEQTGLVVTARLLQGPAEGTVGSFMVHKPE
ncbi:hypothetical protein ACIA6D_36595 [Streptomyces cacaoi]|uniref:hypothetical protein n=1 Tax=Streptomyces cacaoi TaxID=1898 RepID=UPI003749F4CE